MTASALPLAATIHLLAGLGFVGVLAWLSLIDWRTRRLPNPIVLPGLWVGLLLSASGEGFTSPADAILGCAGGYAVLWAISAAYAVVRGGVAFGGGDLKLAAMIGAWLGIASIPAVLFVAFVSGTCAVVPFMVSRRLRFSHKVPFGPALALGGGVVLLVGPTLAGLLSP